MKTLTDHKVNGLNEALEITVLDEPGQGGACHVYEIKVNRTPSLKPSDKPSGPPYESCLIAFQNGPILEAGVNGVSQESLLAIIIDRLRSFQAGPYACRENAQALTNCEQAMMWLQKRTRDRIARGVEGTNVK